jgi:GNAT superfamily N-acetyltransferase
MVSTNVIVARSRHEYESVQSLMRDYECFLLETFAMSLDFQDFESEMAAFPGKYGPPNGACFLALVDDEPAGCLAYSLLKNTTAELKRLYVSPQFRGHQLGKKLLTTACIHAQTAGYTHICLDSFKALESAGHIY